MTAKKKEQAEEEGKAAAKVATATPAKKKLFFNPICITHTSLSTKNKINNGAAQQNEVKRMLKVRGFDIDDHEIHVLDLGPRPELNDEIKAWILANPKGATFRNSIFTSCERIIGGWKGQKVNKITKPVTK